MLDIITTLFYCLTFILLSFWFLFKHNDRVRPIMGKGFLLALGTFLWCTFFLAEAVSYWSLVGHLVALFVGGFFLNTFSAHKIIFIPMLSLMVIGYWSGTMGWAYQQESVAADWSNLDPEHELLIELKNGHQLSELQNIVAQYDLVLTLAFSPQDKKVTELDDYYTVNIPTDRLGQYQEIINAFQVSNLIDHIEPNEILSLDPMEQQHIDFNKKNKGIYSVNDPEIHKVWGHKTMEIEALYQLMKQRKVKPKKKARIAIIDTGVDAQHEDLADNFVSMNVSYDRDPIGHGTHCAGIAAAVSNNKKGIASFAPTTNFVEVSSVKVFGEYGNTTQRRIIEGMLLAVDQGADVLSMSLGGPATTQGIRAYTQAVEYANQKGAIVVVAAGNENMDASRRLPAAINGVITVAALDAEGKKATFSNTVGRLNRGIAAPGVQIYSTIPNNRYDFFNGTSMATPYVAGLVGLMKAIQPQLTTEEAYIILESTGKETQNTAATGRLISPVGAIQRLLN